MSDDLSGDMLAPSWPNLVSFKEFLNFGGNINLWVVHGGAVVTHLPPTSGSNPGPYVGKLVVAYRWSAVY